MDRLKREEATLTEQIKALQTERRRVKEQLRRREFQEKYGVSRETYYRKKRAKR